jgi:FlaA1/EpsC-like NDP-sugar epimerase/glycosyltransferase involved in cell wall biosynthesis
VLRILHVVTRSHRRGAEVAALELAAALDLRGHKDSVVALALAGDGQDVEGLPSLVASTRLGLRTLVSGARRLRSIVTLEQPDIVVAHGGSAAVVVALACTGRAGPKLVWQRILGFPCDRWGMVRQRLWRWVARRFDGVIALTREMVDEMRRLGYRGPAWLLPNARNPHRFTRIDRSVASELLRRENGIAPDVPLLAFVGHLVDQKQPELAVDVLAEVHRSGHRAHLVVAGDGPLSGAVLQRVRDLGVEAHVTLLGHRDDPEVVFGAADLTLITSRVEGIPGVAIEAQMTGCPVVSFLVGAVEDVVEDGVTGAIVAEPDARQMADRVVELLRDREAMTAMGAAATTRAGIFTTTTTATLYAERFEELAAEPGESGTPARGLVDAAGLLRLVRRFNHVALRVTDAGAVAAAWLLAALAGFNDRADAAALRNLVWFVGAPVLISLVVNSAAGLYGPVWRYASNDEAARVLAAVAIGTTVSTILTSVLAARAGISLGPPVVWSVAALGSCLGLGGIRFQSRVFAVERQRNHPSMGPAATAVRALVVGGGDAGAALAYELLYSHAPNRTMVVGFVDDDPRLKGRTIRGVPVLGTTADLRRLCRTHDIDRILVTLPDTEERKAVLSSALTLDAQVMVLSPASERVDGHLLHSLRDLDVTHLLGRPHTPVDSAEIATYLAGATVLVTGAGGSIGSEAVRQIMSYGPRRLVLVDREETLLHDIAMEVPGTEPVLADITDQERLERVFADHTPDVVLHIAAQKHVPMLERFPLEAVRTNVLGTWMVATTAVRHGCDRLILISTDKAAAPHSVMGATKRLAEQIVFEVGRRSEKQFVAVRFGNVLGTRGSVVPTFVRQILDGGPVTVTDPEMTRYFMTVSESVSLVLQAGAMAQSGGVFLLDMGEPVPILRLAQQLIRLAGLRPGQDIAVRYVGLRPGERLHEQLHDSAERVEASAHPAIQSLVPCVREPWWTLPHDMDDLALAVARGDAGAAVQRVHQILVRRGVPCEMSAVQAAEQHHRIDLDALASEPTIAGTAAS